MTAPISQITVYSNASVLGSTLVTVGTFPVDNSSERSATLRGENCVKIHFMSGQTIPIPAFSFIEYDGQLFFLKETYRPVPKGDSYYEYNMKFVSFDNMLSKPQAYRKVVVSGKTWNEPDIDVVGNLADIATIIKDSIIETAGRYEGVFADMLSKVELVDDEININSESKAFSYSGQKISQVLDAIATDYEIDYWFEQVGDTQNGISQMILHFAKYEIQDGELHVSDKSARSNPFTPLKPTISLGLEECTFANEWSGVVQRITPFGSERNIKRGQAIENQMYVSFGKRLRLEHEHSCTIDGTTYQHAYAVKNEDGDLEPLYVDENGAVYVPGVTTGEEDIKKYDDIYPRVHFRVTHVTQRGVDTQIYTVYAIPTVERNGQFVDLTSAEIDAIQADSDKKLFPIDIADGQTLSLHFESGYLNGREFEVANKTAKMKWNGSAYEVDPDNGQWVACFEINPEGDNNDSPQVPYGNLIPRGKFDSTTGYEGDMFAIFNMDMPAFYVEDAQNELAQKAYDEIVGILSTRPEVKCKGNEDYFKNETVFLGQRMFVTSYLFGKDIHDNPLEFISRVTNFSYPLSKPNTVSFRLCSSRVQGSIAIMKGAISDQTNNIMGVGQTARSLSRRAFRDAQEMARMLQAVVAEMMVVGVERNQFTFTMGIECLETTVNGIRRFDGLKITAGEIQHTQEPYIKDAWEGHYTVDAVNQLVTTAPPGSHDIRTDDVIPATGNTYRQTPYYLYAVINQQTGKADMQLWADKKDGENDEAYLLLGILSSEFLDGNTSLRVFNKSNGFTQIAGGSITTEQLQDPTRQLIIDMSSNPPRIIAKRGAQIIGNITFISSNGTETNLATKITSMDGDIAEAQENASDALEKANNIADDGIISGGTEKATIKKEWQEIAGDNMLGGSTSPKTGSYYEAKKQASDYGVTSGTEITNINTAYTNLDNAMKVIIGYNPEATPVWTDSNMHIDTYLMNSDGTQPTRPSGTNYLAYTRDGFAALWRTYYDAEIALLNAVSDVIDTREIGGENILYVKEYYDNQLTCEEGNVDSYYEELTYYSGSGASRQHTFYPAGKYVFSANDVFTDVTDYHADVRLYIAAFNSSGQEVAAVLIPAGTSSNRASVRDVLITTNASCYFCLKIVCDGTNMLQYCQGSAKASNMQLQKGVKSTSYNNYMEHLSNAIKGTTDINGGLVMLNVLMLKNEQGHVTAGMSGLQGTSQNPEKVLMWGGATYQQALAAATSLDENGDPDYIMNALGQIITTLLKKDGTGKIGVFYIGKDHAKIKTDYGIVKMDDDEGVSCILPDGEVAVKMTPKELTSLQDLMSAETVSETIRLEDGGIEHSKRVENRDNPSNLIWVDGESFEEEIYLNADGIASIQITAYEIQCATNPLQPAHLERITEYLYCRITDPNGNVTNQTLSNGTTYTYTPTVTGTYTIEYWMRFKLEFDQADEYSLMLYYSEDRDYAKIDYSYTRAHKQTMVAKGGLFTFQGDKNYLYYKDGVGFDCRVGNFRLRISSTSGIKVDGLQSGSTGLSTGQLYLNGESICRKA